MAKKHVGKSPQHGFTESPGRRRNEENLSRPQQSTSPDNRERHQRALEASRRNQEDRAHPGQRRPARGGKVINGMGSI